MRRGGEIGKGYKFLEGLQTPEIPEAFKAVADHKLCLFIVFVLL